MGTGGRSPDVDRGPLSVYGPIDTAFPTLPMLPTNSSSRPAAQAFVQPSLQPNRQLLHPGLGQPPLSADCTTCESIRNGGDRASNRLSDRPHPEATFLYFAYGSCMCPVDLQRTIGEPAYPYAIGPAVLDGYRLGFNWRSPRRDCGVLDVVPDGRSRVFGVLYELPWRVSDRLDEREDVPRGGYRQELISVQCQGQRHDAVRTYVVVEKLPTELAPNDWYFNVVLRGATTCGLPEDYCWNLFQHMVHLQRQQQRQQQGHYGLDRRAS